MDGWVERKKRYERRLATLSFPMRSLHLSYFRLYAKLELYFICNDDCSYS